MSSITKLSIIGVRSYSPEDEMIINFSKPLTLILGHNGAGKTTIIECLKMISAGTLPPNAQGGKTFICDPKLLGKPETKAKIQLVFTAINGKKILALRSFQLTHTDKTTNFRQTEQVLKTKNKDGEIASITHTCAEMERQVPELMGVSQAVLENVIFCHQEESLWPFAETATLKKIFDELFDTTVYTNLLENMRKIQKEYKKDAKEKTQNFELNRKDYETLARVRKNMLGDLESIVSLQQDLKSYDQRVEGLTKKLKISQNDRNLYGNKLAILEDKIDIAKRAKAALTAQLKTEGKKIFNDNSLNDLERVEQELHNKFQKLEQERKDLTQTRQQKMEERDVLQADLNQLLNSESNSNEIAGTLKRIKEESIKLFKLQNISTDLEEKLNTKLLSTMKEKCASLDLKIATFLQDYQKESAELEAKSKENYRLLVQAESQITDLKTKVGDNNRKKAGITRDLSQMKNQYGQRENLEKQAREMAEQLENLKESKIDEDQSKTKLSKDNLELNRQLAESQQKQTKLQKKQEYDKKNEEINSIISNKEIDEVELMTLCENLKAISDAKIPENYDKDKTLVLINALERKITADRTTLQTKLDKIEFLIRDNSSFITIKQKEVERLRAEMDRFTTKLEENGLSDLGTRDKDFGDQYQDLKKNYKELETKMMMMDYTVDFQNELFQKTKTHKKCAFCTKKLEEGDFEKLEKKVQERLKISSDWHNKEKAEAEAMRKKKQLFKELKIEYDVYQRNKQQIGQIDREIGAKTKDNLLNEKQIGPIRASLENWNNIKDTIENIRQVIGKIKETDRKLQGLRKNLGDFLRDNPGIDKETLNYKDVPDSKALLQQLEANAKQLEKSNKTSEELSRKIEQTANQKAKLDEQLREIQSSSDKFAAKEKELETIEKETKEAEAKIAVCNNELVQFRQKEKEFQTAKEALQKKKTNFDAENIELKTKANSMLQELQKYSDLWSNIQNKSKQRQDLENQREKMINQIEASNQELEKIKERLDKIEKSLSKKDEETKLIENNIRIKRYEAELAQYENDSVQLRKIKEEFDQQERENNKIRQEVEQEKAKYNQTNGKYTVVTNSFEKNFKEYKTKMPGSQKLYVESLVQSEISQYVVEDLDLYTSHLEKALMLFHKQKMEEINKIIADLWIKTYKGNDIKKIEIRSDTEQNARNKSYNYRVVYHTPEGKELDMKGRCSMGQKVIASIVIRMALAEAFCLRCGIMTLDEPTTNLDKDHIKRLAKELVNLIESRVDNKNFQLLIITHDKDFLRYMSDYSSSYYHVFKDAEGFSKVEKLAIDTL